MLYAEVWISWSISDNPLDFEITRVDSIEKQQCYELEIMLL